MHIQHYDVLNDEEGDALPTVYANVISTEPEHDKRWIAVQEIHGKPKD